MSAVWRAHAGKTQRQVDQGPGSESGRHGLDQVDPHEGDDARGHGRRRPQVQLEREPRDPDQVDGEKPCRRGNGQAGQAAAPVARDRARYVRRGKEAPEVAAGRPEEGSDSRGPAGLHGSHQSEHQIRQGAEEPQSWSQDEPHEQDHVRLKRERHGAYGNGHERRDRQQCGEEGCGRDLPRRESIQSSTSMQQTEVTM